MKKRKEEGVKRKKKIKNNNNKVLLKKKPKTKKNKPAGFKLAKQVLLVFLAAANSWGPAKLFSILTSRPALGQPPVQLSSGPRTHRFRRSPSSGLWVCTHRAFCDPVGTHGLRTTGGVHSPSSCPPGFRFLLPAPHSPTGAPGCWVDRRLELLLQNSPKSPQGSFSFWENPPQSCCCIQGRACPLAQPTSPARLGTVQVRAPHGPTLNFPHPTPTVSVCLPLRPCSPPCDFKETGLLVLLKPCLAGKLAVCSLLGVLHQARGHRPGAAFALVPVLVPGTFLSWSSPLTVFSVLYTFWSPIFIYAGVLLAVLFVPQ